MRFLLLGPLQVVGANGPLTISAAMQRLVLAVLLLETGRAVSAERMIVDFWGDRPPPSARKTIQGYVWRLRTLLDGSPHGYIETVDSGYRMRASADDVDSLRFEQLVREGQRAFTGGDLTVAARRLADALAMWRGQALVNVPSTPHITVARTRLEEARLCALAGRFDIELAARRHLAVVPELRAVTMEYPLNEGFHAQLMLALYRSRRPAEALGVFHGLRSSLATELGVDPGPLPQRLYRQILRNDPELTRPWTGLAGVSPWCR